MKNYWGARDDYEQEQIELEEKRAHEDEHCEGLPYCVYCLEQRDLEELIDHINGELDKDEKRADEHHERYEEMRKQQKPGRDSSAKVSRFQDGPGRNKS